MRRISWYACSADLAEGYVGLYLECGGTHVEYTNGTPRSSKNVPSSQTGDDKTGATGSFSRSYLSKLLSEFEKDRRQDNPRRHHAACKSARDRV